jgi:hypothetical protein
MLMVMLFFHEFVIESLRTELGRLGMVDGIWATLSHGGRRCQCSRMRRTSDKKGQYGRLPRGPALIGDAVVGVVFDDAMASRGHCAKTWKARD